MFTCFYILNIYESKHLFSLHMHSKQHSIKYAYKNIYLLTGTHAHVYPCLSDKHEDIR